MQWKPVVYVALVGLSLCYETCNVEWTLMYAKSGECSVLTVRCLIDLFCRVLDLSRQQKF